MDRNSNNQCRDDQHRVSAESSRATSARATYQVERDTATGARDVEFEESPPVPQQEHDRSDPSHDAINCDDEPDVEHALQGSMFPTVDEPLDLASTDEAETETESLGDDFSY